MANLPPLQYEVSSDAELEDHLCEAGLKVLEIYSEWCGPCASILPTFKKLRLDKDDETCLKFLKLKAEACDMLDLAQQHRGRSEPLFLFYRNGRLKKEHQILGANTPLIMKLVGELTPSSPDADQNDFRRYRRGVRTLYQCIGRRQWHLQDNPFYVARQHRLAGK